MPERAITRSVGVLMAMVLWILATGTFAAGGGEDQGALVHVADTRDLAGLNLYFANLYNADRIMFTVVSVGLTGLVGLGLGLLMDLLVGAIGLDLSKRESRE
jgi:hypothetical protein